VTDDARKTGVYDEEVTPRAKGTIVRRKAGKRPERVRAGIEQLIGSWHHNPAYVHNQFLEVLATNPLAIALSPSFTPGVNRLRAMFLDPTVRDLHRDWEVASAQAVGWVRALAGSRVESPELVRLVGQISVKSVEFRRLWARREVQPRPSGTGRLDHPEVGPLDLRYENLALDGQTGQQLVVFHADPGSASADGLALLGALSAGDRS